MALSVREKQLEVVRRMLNFNTDPPPPNKSGTPSPAFGVSQLDSAKTSIWKILIYDRHGRDIISPLMKVGDLRQHGITIHALIDSDRQAVQDAPAIYFVMPTEENIRTIISDIENRLYETFHINFVSTIPTALLHTFAEAVAKSDCVSLVPKVFDQYCDFMALEGKLFSLGLSGSYSNFHNLKLSESDAKRNSQLVVDGLFAVLATMGTLPIIRCSRNDAAEMVGTMLDDKLRKHMKSHNHLFPENSIRQQRPVLLILDRDTDLNVALHHSWTYQALIHDVLDLKLNKVTFQAPESNAHSGAPPRRVMKTFDFDSHDIFWRDNAGLPFPKAAENVEKFVAEYKEQFDQLALLQASSDDAAATAEIAARIKSLPETTERKRQIDMHTLIATVILDKVKERRLDEFFMMEESILIKGSIDKKKLMSMVQDPAYGLPQDRMRLFLMYYLSNDLTQDEYDACVAALAKSGCDTSPSEYIKQLKRMKSFSADRMAMASSSSSSVSKKTQAIQEGLATFIMGGIQSILPVNKDLAVTRIVDAVMDLKSTPETDNLLYLDPKMVNLAHHAW
eukprot:TRINITY_DN6876_c0_g1_i1.p1 TRINITY_DN6876_c0_g1~~TRINITY_DN6876_c0_g1_i1.p1  ORF type:complete len:564 (+),score=129.41 TRINITY_DN6876_c0_g1_i1:60-1751(+)